MLPKNWLDYDLDRLACLAPCELIERNIYREHKVKVMIKREDQLDLALGGNKFYKLYHYLKAFKGSQCQTLASFGGPYSNHLHALAVVGATLGIHTMAFIRGDYHQHLSPTLVDAQARGMSLVFLSVSQYRQKDQPAYLEELKSLYPQCFWVPEGGGGEIGCKGTQSLGRAVLKMTPGVDEIAIPSGTGASAAGIARAVADAHVDVKVFSSLVLKLTAEQMRAYRRRLINDQPAIEESLVLDNRFHCGGYAKLPDYLRKFMQVFEKETKIILDPVYTVKLFWAIEQRLLAGEIIEGSTIVAIHSGGLQGRRGYDLGN